MLSLSLQPSGPSPGKLEALSQQMKSELLSLSLQPSGAPGPSPGKLEALSQQMKSELHQKRQNNSKYKRMMVSTLSQSFFELSLLV